MATETALNALLSESARAVAAGDDAAQLDFLPSVKRVDMIDPGAVKAWADGERKRGRPKGAEGVASRQLREMISRLGGNPLLNMARWAGLEPEELAVRLGITKAEAFAMLVSMWDKLAPYTAAKLAPVDDKGRAVTPMFLAVGGQAVNADGTAEPPWARRFRTIEAEAEDVETESEQNQSLSAISIEKSNDEKSNGGR